MIYAQVFQLAFGAFLLASVGGLLYLKNANNDKIIINEMHFVDIKDLSSKREDFMSGFICYIYKKIKILFSRVPPIKERVYVNITDVPNEYLSNNPEKILEDDNTVDIFLKQLNMTNFDKNFLNLSKKLLVLKKLKLIKNKIKQTGYIKLFSNLNYDAFLAYSNWYKENSKSLNACFSSDNQLTSNNQIKDVFEDAVNRKSCVGKKFVQLKSISNNDHVFVTSNSLDGEKFFIENGFTVEEKGIFSGKNHSNTSNKVTFNLECCNDSEEIQSILYSEPDNTDYFLLDNNEICISDLTTYENQSFILDLEKWFEDSSKDIENPKKNDISNDLLSLLKFDLKCAFLAKNFKTKYVKNLELEDTLLCQPNPFSVDKAVTDDNILNTNLYSKKLVNYSTNSMTKDFELNRDRFITSNNVSITDDQNDHCSVDELGNDTSKFNTGSNLINDSRYSLKINQNKVCFKDQPHSDHIKTTHTSDKNPSLLKKLLSFTRKEKKLNLKSQTDLATFYNKISNSTFDLIGIQSAENFISHKLYFIHDMPKDLVKDLYFPFFSKLISLLSIDGIQMNMHLTDLKMRLESMVMIKSIKIPSKKLLNTASPFLKYLMNISSLDISSIGIVDLPAFLEDLVFLESLDISENPLVSIDILTKFKNLKHLNAKRVGYDVISGLFNKKHNTRPVSPVSQTFIKTKDESYSSNYVSNNNTASLKTIESINGIDSNFLRQKNKDFVYSEFDSSEETVALGNSGVYFKSYKYFNERLERQDNKCAYFGKDTSLLSLFVDYNYIDNECLKKILFSQQNLKVFSCSNNKITDLSPLINLGNLAYLNLSNNPTDSDPFIYLVRCRNLREVNLMGTNIKSLRVDFDYFPKLTKLILGYCVDKSNKPVVILQGARPPKFIIIGDYIEIHRY